MTAADDWNRNQAALPPPEFDPSPEGFVRFEPMPTTRNPRSSYPGKWNRFDDGQLGIWCPECTRGDTLALSVDVDGLTSEPWTCRRCGLVGCLHLVDFEPLE